MKIYTVFFTCFLFAGMILFVTSCTPGACFENTDSFLKASFYSNSTKKLAAPDSLTVYGLNMQSNYLYNKEARVQPALLPLNPTTGECTYIVKINGIIDTIKFIYSSYPHLVSKECGYTFFSTLDTFYYSKNNIDYIYTGSKKISTLNEENIRIFY